MPLYLRIKVELSRSKKVPFICYNENPFQNDKKCFLFHVKSSFRSLDIYIFVLIFWLCRKRLDKKAKDNFKIFDVTDWEPNKYNTHISQYLKK